MNDDFYFAEITNTETQTFDNSLEHFHSAGIVGTVRENIQNSIDARISLTEPVVVRINSTKIKKQDIPGMDQIERHIKSLEGGNNYTKETIQHMRAALSEEEVQVLTFEDSHTRGLEGAELVGEESTYNIFAYKKGVHYEEKDTEIETVRGGSHGVGKIANNAASDIHLMYFANCDQLNNKHLGGTIHLIEHTMEGQSYRATGYFSKMNMDQNYLPYKNIGYHPIFEKNTRGLKIIIPFFREKKMNTTELITAVCDNFFIAILNNQLKVIVTREDQDEIILSKTTIREIIQDNRFYPENINTIEKIKKNFTPLYLETYINQKPIKLEVNTTKETFHFDLYFIYNEKIKTGRVGIIRSMGMKIVDYKVKNNVRRPFNAVLIGKAREDEFLKTLKNESHTDLSHTALRDPSAKKEARKFLKNLDAQISQKIDEAWEKLNPSDGKIDTSDLLYEKEVTFQTKLIEMSEKVLLSDGKQIRKKKNKEYRNPQKKHSQIESKLPDKKRTRKPRKLRKTNQDESITETLILPNESVQRIDFLDREIIHFDLTTIKDMGPLQAVNIGFRLVDGDGKEYDNEFDLVQMYDQINNDFENSSCKFDSFTIYNVKVIKNSIKLSLVKKKMGKSNLKFVYKLEVLT